MMYALRLYPFEFQSRKLEISYKVSVKNNKSTEQAEHFSRHYPAALKTFPDQKEMKTALPTVYCKMH